MTRLAVLLTTALLTVAPTAPAWAQSAGDEQYSDPFDGATTTAPAPPTSTPAPSAPPAPAPTSSPGAAGTATPGAASGLPEPTAVAAPRELARTGLDATKLGLLGLTVALLGIGLRLRTADARR